MIKTDQLCSISAAALYTANIKKTEDIKTKKQLKTYFSDFEKNISDKNFAVLIRKAENDKGFHNFFCKSFIEKHQKRIIHTIKNILNEGNKTKQDNVTRLSLFIVQISNIDLNPKVANIGNKIILQLDIDNIKTLQSLILDNLATLPNGKELFYKLIVAINTKLKNQLGESLKENIILKSLLSTLKSGKNKHSLELNQSKKDYKNTHEQLQEKEQLLKKSQKQNKKTGNLESQIKAHETQILNLQKIIESRKLEFEKNAQKQQEAIKNLKEEKKNITRALEAAQKELFEQKEVVATEINKAAELGEELDQSQLEIKSEKQAAQEWEEKTKSAEAKNQPLTEENEKLLAKVKELEAQNLEFQKREGDKKLKEADLTKQNINEKLELAAKEAAAENNQEFDDILITLPKTLQEEKCGFSYLAITGSRAYLPALKLLDDGIIDFKRKKGQESDLDLCAVVGDKFFAENLKDRSKIEGFLAKILPDFQLSESHIAPYQTGNSTSLKLTHTAMGQEVDINFYGQKDYEKLSSWMYNFDRIRLEFDQKKDDWQFGINNNQVDDNLKINIEKFLLDLENEEENAHQLWDFNPEAKGFIKRIQSDCGKLKMPVTLDESLLDKLAEEMKEMAGMNWNDFKKNHCQTLIQNNRKAELNILEQAFNKKAEKSQTSAPTRSPRATHHRQYLNGQKDLGLEMVLDR